ncbi:MAG TPA: DUF2231 domain-containing protein [Terriglobales bacterium]|nr:DUF2231 domain-containing protein [Terriglobales bacterium]
MIQFPPIPAWDAFHPLIVHFPIALLLVAPLFIVMGALLQPEKGRAYMFAALILMAVGTSAVFVALETGEAAAKLAERTPEINAVLEHHEQLAELTRVVFSALTVLLAAILLLPRLLRRSSGWLVGRALPLIFLVFYGAGTLLLVNTAHNGGRLVHEFGVHALVQPGEPPPAAAAAEGD